MQNAVYGRGFGWTAVDAMRHRLHVERHDIDGLFGRGQHRWEQYRRGRLGRKYE
jgi:hypothetical protein